MDVHAFAPRDSALLFLLAPLFSATWFGERIVRALQVHFKADLWIADAEGFTAVHWLASNGRTQHIEFLLSLLGDGDDSSDDGGGGGPPVDFEDHNGTTALQVRG